MEREREKAVRGAFYGHDEKLSYGGDREGGGGGGDRGGRREEGGRARASARASVRRLQGIAPSERASEWQRTDGRTDGRTGGLLRALASLVRGLRSKREQLLRAAAAAAAASTITLLFRYS